MTLRCDCGLPLHYTNPEIRRQMERMVEQFGPCIEVTVAGRSWMVSRHYIALHGISGSELPELARKFGWEHVR